MNTDSPIGNPPTDLQGTEAPMDNFFGFVIHIPDHAALSLAAPKNNVYAVMILTAFLKAEFSRANLQPRDFIIVGELSDCIGMFCASNLSLGLRTLETSLQACGLFPEAAQIFFYDRAEMIFRTVDKSRLSIIGDMTTAEVMELLNKRFAEMQFRISLLSEALRQSRSE